MQRFPGKTPEELDDVDWLRLQQALEVGRIVDVEARRKLVTDGKLQPDALQAWEWDMIKRHDLLVGEEGD